MDERMAARRTLARTLALGMWVDGELECGHEKWLDDDALVGDHALCLRCLDRRRVVSLWRTRRLA